MSFFPKNATKRALVLVILMSILARVSYAESISPRRLVEVADFSNPIVSPDGRWVAFRMERASIERNVYDSEWYVQDTAGLSPPHRVADGGMPLRDLVGNSTPGTVLWSPDGRWIYYRALLGGRVDVWRAAADGSGADPITHDPANVRNFSLTVDGRFLKYSVGATRDEVVEAEDAEYDNGVRIDETVPIGQGVVRSGYVDGRLATERFTGRWFELRPLLGNTPDRWTQIDLLTGERRDFALRDAPPAPLSVADFRHLSPKPWKIASDPRKGRIALLLRAGDGADDNERPQLAVLASRNSRQLVRCSADACTNKAITGIQWLPEGNEVLFTVTDPHRGHAQSIFRWDVGAGTVLPVTSSNGLIGGGESDSGSACGVTSDELLCVTEEADQPPRLERIDLYTGTRKVLFDPNAALAQDLAKEAPARLLRWSDSKGREFTGQYFPAKGSGSQPAPLFIVYYSCEGFVRGGVGNELPFATLAEDGIAALCINRLEKFAADAIERHDDGRIAAQSAVDLLASQGEVDRSKVGMGGLSYGGAVALWTAAESKLLAAVSVSSPVVTPNYYLYNSLRGAGFKDELKEGWGLGAPDETPARWQAISPAFKVDKISAPILFQNSEQEYLGELEYALPLIRKHRADLYVFPNEAHLKVQPRHKLAVYERNRDWFLFWLKGVVDSDPAKAKQYEYWRAMKASISADSHAH